MVSLRFPDGEMTTDPVEVRRQAMSFCGAIFRKESVDELLRDLPQLGPEERAVLDASVSLEELTAAGGQVAADGAPGMDGVPADLCEHFRRCLGADLWEVLRGRSRTGPLPTCRHAALLPSGV